MPTEPPIRLGPFVGGLNSFSDPTAIDDLELAECVNFDMFPDGSLVSRPPIADVGVDFTLGASGNMQILGWYISSAGAKALIASDGLSSTYYFNGTNWILITNTFAAAAVAQYKDKAWLVAPPGSANPGGSWDFSGFTAVATMPKGRTVAVQKERLWIGAGGPVTSNGSRIYFCAIADPTSWPGDFITVNTGDGQNVLELMTYFQDLLIFKDDSTYRFSYDIDPALGTISRVSDTVGCNGPGTVVTFENRIFVLHGNSLYELSNYNYERLNDKVPFDADNESTNLSAVYAISYFSDRLFVCFFDKLYVWSVKTRTWAVWESLSFTNIGRFFPVPGEQNINATAYLQSRTPRTNKLYRVVDSFGAAAESMVCKITTKNYDYQSAGNFKRIFFWGVDCTTRRTITAIAKPVQYAAIVTWGQLLGNTWSTVKNSTWGRLLGTVVEVTDSVPMSGLTGERKFIKLRVDPKAQRFRQIGFSLHFETDGTEQQAPVILYNLMTWVKIKQPVVKRVS